MDLIVIMYMAVTSAWSGASLRGPRLFGKYDYLPEVLFALAFALAVFPLIGLWSILVWAWSFAWMETGHANALPWGDGGHNPDRTNTLSPVVKWLADKLKIEYYSTNYARLFMAVKGFLITLPVGGTGILLWPLGYEIGERLNSNTIRELLAGAGAGLSIVLFRVLFI